MPKLARYGALACALGILISSLGVWRAEGFAVCDPFCYGAWLLLAGLLFFFAGGVMLLVAVFVSAVHRLRESAASSFQVPS
jgi:hypothetical protein